MKKIIFFALLINYMSNLNAQCNSSLPIIEDFSNTTTISTCWDFIDEDQDGVNWYVADLSGNKGLVSESYRNDKGILTPDNWAISQVIDLSSLNSSSNVILSWRVRARDWSLDKERYTVYASTGNQVMDFTSSNSISVFENLDDTDASGAWANRSLDISSLAGSNVYIAFRHHVSTFQAEINVDDVQISTSLLGSEENKFHKIKHYYNKTNNSLVLKSNTTRLSSIDIYNILGQNVLKKNLSNINETVDLSSLRNGVYFSKVSSDNKMSSFKFLKY